MLNYEAGMLGAGRSTRQPRELVFEDDTSVGVIYEDETSTC